MGLSFELSINIYNRAIGCSGHDLFLAVNNVKFTKHIVLLHCKKKNALLP